MSRTDSLVHEFVEYVPDALADGVLYVSIPFATVVHKCCCGCGNEVVTPLSPTDWQLTFDGESISLHPSIGNWSFECQSHYWIRRNRVTWAALWSRDEISAGRNRDLLEKGRQFGDPAFNAGDGAGNGGETMRDKSIWRRVVGWFRGAP